MWSPVVTDFGSHIFAAPHNLYKLLSLLNGEAAHHTSQNENKTLLFWHLRPLRLWLQYLIGLNLPEFLASHAGIVMPITHTITCSSVYK